MPHCQNKKTNWQWYPNMCTHPEKHECGCDQFWPVNPNKPSHWCNKTTETHAHRSQITHADVSLFVCQTKQRCSHCHNSACAQLEPKQRTHFTDCAGSQTHASKQTTKQLRSIAQTHTPQRRPCNFCIPNAEMHATATGPTPPTPKVAHAITCLNVRQPAYTGDPWKCRCNQQQAQSY